MTQIIQVDRSKGFAFLDTSPGYKDFSFLKGWVFGEMETRSVPLFRADIRDIHLFCPTVEGEFYITGQDRFNRIRQSGKVPMDIAFFQTFWANKHFIPEEFKRDGTIISFDGTIFYNVLGTVSAVVIMWWSNIENKWFCDLRCLSREFSAKFLSAIISIAA